LNLTTARSPVQKIRHLIFLKEVLILAFTSFGGPQVHLAMFMSLFVKKRKYLTEAELLELTALCQVLPGPTSTQTITALGYKIGGAKLAYLTLLVWILPATIIMIAAGFGMTYLRNIQITKFIQPMAVAFVIHAGYTIGIKVVKGYLGLGLMLGTATLAYIFQSPWVCPLALLISGGITALKYNQQQKLIDKQPIKINWANFYLFLGVGILSAVVYSITKSEYARLFENFYRNGSLVFGGGQVLGPMLYTEFVEFKHQLNREEFLSGLAMAQVVPGPVFSISAYIGTLALRGHGIGGQLLGGLVASLGIFLPGAFLIFFVYRIWDQLKQYRPIRASLEGINTASTGLTLAAAVTLFQPMATNGLFVLTIICTVLLLAYTKIPPYLIILGGLLLGVLV
jgi:chromate transporter